MWRAQLITDITLYNYTCFVPPWETNPKRWAPSAVAEKEDWDWEPPTRGNPLKENSFGDKKAQSVVLASRRLAKDTYVGRLAVTVYSMIPSTYTGTCKTLNSFILLALARVHAQMLSTGRYTDTQRHRYNQAHANRHVPPSPPSPPPLHPRVHKHTHTPMCLKSTKVNIHYIFFKKERIHTHHTQTHTHTHTHPIHLKRTTGSHNPSHITSLHNLSRSTINAPIVCTEDNAVYRTLTLSSSAHRVG